MAQKKKNPAKNSCWLMLVFEHLRNQSPTISFSFSGNAYSRLACNLRDLCDGRYASIFKKKCSVGGRATNCCYATVSNVEREQQGNGRCRIKRVSKSRQMDKKN